jgi:hypothetical protein
MFDAARHLQNHDASQLSDVYVHLVVCYELLQLGDGAIKVRTALSEITLRLSWKIVVPGIDFTAKYENYIVK